MSYTYPSNSKSRRADCLLIDGPPMYAAECVCVLLGLLKQSDSSPHGTETVMQAARFDHIWIVFSGLELT